MKTIPGGQAIFRFWRLVLAIELRVLKTAFLSFSASYFTGFKKVIQSDIVYTLNDGPETTATTYSKGDYTSFNMGIRFPIATLGAKKK